MSIKARKLFVLSMIMLIVLFITACGNSSGSSNGGSSSGGSSQSGSAAGSDGGGSGSETKKKFKVYLSLSYSGNAWQNEAANIVEALAKTPPYDEMVELKKVISGADVQKQISDYQSMIADGADAIISFPISPTALDSVITQACEQGVLMFMYDATVTNECAYNVSYITAGQGQNTAQWRVNQLQGKGKIFMSRGVSGNAVDIMQYEGAMSVFNRYPGIEVVAEYYSDWDDVKTKTNTLKALAAHPDVDGIWAEAGEYGAIQALQQTGHKMIPVTGENSNGFRLALKNYANEGLTGVSGGSPPATSGFAFKIMMEMLTGQLSKDEVPHNIEYPLPWVPYDQVTVCEGSMFENGCNAFPEDKVQTSFVTEVFNKDLVPEISLESALEGKPTPGMTIQPIPKEMIKQAPDIPGINCTNCNPPEDLYPLNLELVRPFDQ